MKYLLRAEAADRARVDQLLDMIMRDGPHGKREKWSGNPLDSLLRDIMHSRDPESPESVELKRFADGLEKLFKED